jgi:hypothetical protein
VLLGGAPWCEGIEPAVWEYRVGACRVLERWLGARAGRELSFDETRELRWIVEALRLTLRLQERIAAVDPL